MTYHVEVSSEADQILRECAQWYRDRSGSQAVAEKWYNGFLDVLESLQNDPERHPFAPENGEFPYEIRELTYGSGRRKTHRAIFRIWEEARIVEIMTIRHSAQRRIKPGDL
jgi:plasmid stabilization system protein ParE